MDSAKTVSIVCPENVRAGYKNIPEAEYDPSVHVLFDRETGKPVAPLEPLSIAKGPRGNWYVMRGKERVSEGFKDEDDAKVELAKIEAGEGV